MWPWYTSYGRALSKIIRRLVVETCWILISDPQLINVIQLLLNAKSGIEFIKFSKGFIKPSCIPLLLQEEIRPIFEFRFPDLVPFVYLFRIPLFLRWKWLTPINPEKVLQKVPYKSHTHSKNITKSTTELCFLGLLAGLMLEIISLLFYFRHQKKSLLYRGLICHKISI